MRKKNRQHEKAAETERLCADAREREKGREREKSW